MKLAQYACDWCQWAGDEKVFHHIEVKRISVSIVDPLINADICAICWEHLEKQIARLAAQPYRNMA